MWWGNDITKCPGKSIKDNRLIECLCKDQCHRYTVPPDKYQSYSDFVTLLEDGKECKYFMSNE